jgi:uncharacterized protein
MSRLAVGRRAWPLALGAGALLGLHATRWSPYRPVMRWRTIEVPATWPAIEILHLSDLHLRRSDPELLTGQLRALNRLDRQPDLVCVTGDVCERATDAPLVVELLRTLRPRIGTYVIAGNHEYGAGSPHALNNGEGHLADLFGKLFAPIMSSGVAEGVETVTLLRAAGLHVLRNQGIRLATDAQTLWLAGVDDGWADLADVGAAMRGRQADEGALVLIHEPELAFPAIELGADLVLAGHTHGGQVRLPFVGAPYWHRLDRRLTVPAGVQPLGKAQLHISAGMGQLLPLRLGCPPEMAWLTCVPAAHSVGRASKSADTPRLDFPRS